LNKELSYYYRILGLQFGASPTEIRAAYRRLVKLYHPDKDQSADSMAMYKEIRTAYEKLLNCDYSGVTGIKTETKTATKTSTNAGTGTRANTGTTSNRVSSSSEWTAAEWDNWEKKSFKIERKEIKLRNLFAAFFIAFVIPLRLYSPIFHHEYYDYDNYSILTTIAIYNIVSWIFFSFLRRHFTPSMWSLIIRILAGALYGMVLVVILCLRYGLSEAELAIIGITTAISAYALMDMLPEIDISS